MSKIKKLAGETVLYGLGSILPRFLNFLLVPLHTTVLPPSGYGIFTLLFSYVAILNVVFTFGMETAYFRFANKPGADEKRVFNLTQTVVISISFTLCLLFFLFDDNLIKYFEIEGYESILYYLIIIMFVDAIVAIPFARLRFQKRPIKFASVKLLNIFVLVGLNVYLLLFSPFEPNISLIFLANLIANLFFPVFFIKDLLSWRPTFDKTLSPQIFSYAYPVMLTGIAGMMNENLSRITLDWWLPKNFYKDPKAALGVFGAAYKFAVLMNLAIQAFRYAAEPFFFSQSSEKNSPQLFARINHYFIIVCCVLLLSVSINLDILKYFLGQKGYWEALFVVPILLLAYLFLGVYYNFSVWFKLTDRTHFGTIITLIGLMVTIGGNYLLIPVLGYFGSSIIALACYFIMMLVCYGFGQKYYPIPYTIGKDFLYIIITTALVYAVITFDDNFKFSQVITTTLHLFVITLYLGVIYLIERPGLSFKRA